MRRVLPLILLVLGFDASAALAAFDPSEYRQSTYGPPNHYCAPTKSLASSGTGTLGDPWNMSQCATQPVAGDVVGILPGVSVDLPTTNNDNIPAFNPTNSGTSDSNRIVYVTKYAAVALANVATNANRTEFRHNGVAPTIVGGVGAGNGCAMLGANGRNYITYDGFFIDMAHAYMKEDSGVIRAESATGIHFKNFEVKGANLTVASNAVIYRPGGAVDTVLSNFRAYDFHNDGTGSNTPQSALFSDTYGDRNVLIEHFEIYNTQGGIFMKGTAGGTWNYGEIRYGIVHDNNTAFMFNDLDPTHVTTLHHCLAYHISASYGIGILNLTSSVDNLLVHHVTLGDVGNGVNFHGGVWSKGSMGDNVELRDNLIDVVSGGSGLGHGMEFEVTLPDALDYNRYYRSGSTNTWRIGGSAYAAIANWRTATGMETHSNILSSDPFVNRSMHDYRIAAGHGAKTASSTGGEIGAYAGSETVGVDLASGPPPMPPTGVRILR